MRNSADLAGSRPRPRPRPGWVTPTRFWADAWPNRIRPSRSPSPPARRGGTATRRLRVPLYNNRNNQRPDAVTLVLVRAPRQYRLALCPHEAGDGDGEGKGKGKGGE